jgi:hypothetical protein
MCNSVTNYIDILKVFSPKSKEIIWEPEYLKSKDFGIKYPTYLSDTDSSDDDEEAEEKLNFTIAHASALCLQRLVTQTKKQK